MKDLTRFWRNWLVAAATGVMLFGAVLVVAPELTRRLFSLVAFSSAARLSALGEPAVGYISLAHAVLGAVMFGWGAALLFILLGPFRRGSGEAWETLAASVTAWFVPDTAYSLWSGFWQNAVLNAAFGALFAVPLVATRRMRGGVRRPGGDVGD